MKQALVRDGQGTGSKRAKWKYEYKSWVRMNNM